jgi:hypothetical protein
MFHLKQCLLKSSHPSSNAQSLPVLQMDRHDGQDQDGQESDEAELDDVNDDEEDVLENPMVRRLYHVLINLWMDIVKYVYARFGRCHTQ